MGNCTQVHKECTNKCMSIIVFKFINYLLTENNSRYTQILCFDYSHTLFLTFWCLLPTLVDWSFHQIFLSKNITLYEKVFKENKF